MADYTAANVLIGVGKLSIDGSSIGYTSGGVNLVHSSDKMDKDVDQSYAAIGVHKIRENFQITTNLAEATLENLKLIWEMTTSITVAGGTRTLSWGMNSSVIERTLEFRGKSPEGYDRIYTVRKAVIWETGEVPHAKDALTVIPVTFRVLPDITMSAGLEYGSIVDNTA